jgi:hypothetical protein
MARLAAQARVSYVASRESRRGARGLVLDAAVEPAHTGRRAGVSIRAGRPQPGRAASATVDRLPPARRPRVPAPSTADADGASVGRQAAGRRGRPPGGRPLGARGRQAP